MLADDSEFLRTVEELKSAEKEAELVKSTAQSESEKILKSAKEEIVKLNQMLEDEIVKKKNTLLEQGNKKIENDVKKIITEGKIEASNLKKKKIQPKSFERLIDYFMSV